MHWTFGDIWSVTSFLKKGRDWAMGPEIEEFEREIAKLVGTKYALAFNSGTSALHAAMIALEIGKGDEVIVPSFTFIATANAPLFVGAKPIFADIETERLGLDPKDVLKKITKKTKAIIPVHYGGRLCEIKELKKIADDHGLFLIEDACEAIGTKGAGKYGNLSVFSFCQNKVITTGEGGAITTNNKVLYNKLKQIRSHGKDNSNYNILGYNFRLPTALACLGLSQLKKIQKIIAKRKANAKYLSKKLGIDFFTDSTYQLFSMFFKDEISRDMKRLCFAENGIQTKVYFEPIHLTPFYKRLGYKIKLPVTEEVSKKILTLPMYPDLTRKEMDYIANTLWKTTF